MDMGLKHYLSISVSIALFVALCYLALGRGFAFADIGLDSYSYFYPLQIVQSQQMRDYYELTWSFRLGLGGYIGAVVNPLQLALFWIPDAWQLDSRLPVYFTKLLLAGAFFYAFLRQVRFDSRLACIGALSYAFSNYATINEQWDSIFILQFSACLYLLEGYFKTGKPFFAVAFGLVASAAGVIEIYMLGLLALIYIAARYAFFDTRHDAHRFIRSFFGFSLLATIGFLLLAFMQAPNVMYLLDSPRVSGEHSKFEALFEKLLSLNDRKTIGAEIAGLFGKDLLGTASAYRGYQNYFEAPGFYVGILMLLCGPQLLGPSATRREKMFFLTGTILLVVYFLWPAMRHAVYGFGHTGFRVSTLWVSAGLIALGLYGLRRAISSGFWRKGLLLSAAAIVVLLACVVWRMGHWVKLGHLLLVLSFLAMYIGILWLHRHGNTSPPLTSLLIVIVACELFLFASPAWFERNAVSRDGTSSRGSYQDGTPEALAFIDRREDSGEFYRVEKNFDSFFLNDALVQDYHGTKSYFFHGKALTRFVDRMELPRYRPRPNYVSRMTGRHDVLHLVGVKYFLSRDRKPDRLRWAQHVATIEGIEIYRNNNWTGAARLYSDVAPEAATDGMGTRERDAFLLDTIIAEQSDQIQTLLADEGRSIATGTTPPTGTVHLHMVDDRQLLANVQTSHPAVLMVAMPFERGWSAEVDGKPARMFRAQFGLSAVVVGPDTRSVRFTYQVPGRKEGQWLSLVALGLLLTGFAIRHVRRRTPPLPAHRV